MHTDDRIDLVSNNTKDIEQYRARYSYGDNKNANMPSDKKAYQYRHRFGMSFNEVGLVASNDFDPTTGCMDLCWILILYSEFGNKSIKSTDISWDIPCSVELTII